MIQAATNGKNRYEGTSAALKVTESAATGDAARTEYSAVASLEQLADLRQLNRTSPRRSVVLVVSESRSISPDFLADGLRARGDEQVDVLVACAGQPADLSALQHCIADAQFLLAPAGTSVEDLREMAMAQASGDIVTLVTAPLLSESVLADQPLVRGS